MRWFDIWYAKDDNEDIDGFNDNSLFLGLEGEYWQYADDKKETYSWIGPITSFQTLRDNQNKVTEDTGLPQYLHCMSYPAEFPLMEIKVKATQTRQEPYLTMTYPKTVRYSAEDSDRIAELEAEINPYKDEMTIKFIKGEEPIDNFDNFIEMLKNMGVEELIELKQKAYDKWNELSN